MVAFVAGATGYVGREVVRALREQGHRTLAHVRPDSSRLAEWRRRWEVLGAEVDTTAWTAEAMNARLAELAPTMVFALLGTTRKRAKASGDAGDSYETVDYGLTKLLLDAAVASGSSPRFVYLSSAGVTEKSRGAYMAARARAEKAIRNADIPHTIARPSFITGPGRDESRPGERVGAAVANGALAAVGLLGGRKLRDRYRSTTNTVLAEALVRLACDAEAADRTFESEQLR